MIVDEYDNVEGIDHHDARSLKDNDCPDDGKEINDDEYVEEDIDNLDEVDLNIADRVMLRRRAAVYSFSSVDDDDNKSVPTTTTTVTS